MLLYALKYVYLQLSKSSFSLLLYILRVARMHTKSFKYKVNIFLFCEHNNNEAKKKNHAFYFLAHKDFHKNDLDHS